MNFAVYCIVYYIITMTWIYCIYLALVMFLPKHKYRKHCKLQSHWLIMFLSTGIAEVYKLESNKNLRLTLDSMQMPTVEYKEINVDDYSMCHETEPQ